MNSSDLELERGIFDRCLELPAEERPDYIRSACREDKSLELRIYRLLALHEKAELTTDVDPGRLVLETEDPQQIGPYRIVKRIGEGGMGIVYAAEQTRPVRRRVALKVIKLGMDSRDILARFDSERQALALMNHPNIARILDAGATESGRPYFVMEYVPGVSIIEFCDQKQLPVDRRLELFEQVCRAIKHAHQKGIVHRDLKPSNILVSEEEGTPHPKVIDFGIAKATSQKLSDITIQTKMGQIIGTPEYMSPEQAELSNIDVDTRSDVYSLGVILYELVTGTRPFEFRDVRDYSEIQRVILEEEPDPPSLRVRKVGDFMQGAALNRASSPARLARHLRGDLDWIAIKALAKDPSDRYQTALQLAEEVARYLSNEPLRVAPPGIGYRTRKLVRRHRLAAVVAAAATASLVLVAWAVIGPLGVLKRPATIEVTRALIGLEAERPLWQGLSRPIALSPDGRRLAMVLMEGGAPFLYLRELDSFSTVKVRESQGARAPFFSPGGDWVAFFAQGHLKKARATGGRPQTIANTGLAPRGASWRSDGSIVFAEDSTPGLQLVSADGGTPRLIAAPDQSSGELEYLWPEWIPGRNEILLTVRHTSQSGALEELAILRLSDGEITTLRPGSQPSVSSEGYLVYANGGGLEAASFDPPSGKGIGPPVVVQENVQSYSGGALIYGLSRSGTLVYSPAEADRVHLDWISRSGEIIETLELAGTPGWPQISPDGHRAAIHLGRPEGRNVWIIDLDRPGSMRQMTFQEGGFPVWSPDGRRIAFMSRQGGSADIYSTSAMGRGEPEEMVSGNAAQIPVSWSKDGVLAYYEVASATQRDIWLISAEDGGEPTPFVKTAANEFSPIFSPDGTWVAYVSDETGQNEVYVRSYPSGQTVVPVSIGGGSEPRWRHDGRSLFYRSGDSIMAVTVQEPSRFVIGQPRRVLQTDMVTNPGNPSYDVSEDGNRFLMLRPARRSSGARLRLVVNWATELSERLAALP